MAERTILVCDACGRPAAETVTIRVGRGNFVKDLCAAHVSELTSGSRKPRPGRRKAVVGAVEAARKPATAKRRGRPRKKATARKRATARKKA
ncbi:MAG: hypothetical protein HY240_01320 [Actinobacteria bacterium]|nr:hypothetical protein [Actinomycetota bacterium]